MKQKIKKIKKIKSKLTSDYNEVLLEEMNSNLKLILEDHTGLNRKIDGLDKKIDKNHKEFQEFRKEVNFKFDAVNNRLDGIDSNFKTVFKFLSQIDNELKSIKKELKNKADLTFLKTLEKRIKKLEINYAELHSLILQRCG